MLPEETHCRRQFTKLHVYGGGAEHPHAQPSSAVDIQSLPKEEKHWPSSAQCGTGRAVKLTTARVV